MFLISLLIVIILFRLILMIIVKKYGKFSFDGLNIAGFSYDYKKDAFYSTHIAWQKYAGYTHIYDVIAPLLRMTIDTEPITFKYNDKSYLLTFWKGQYGICTGAEIGIYASNDKNITKNTIYYPISKKEMLPMKFILYKKNNIITSINATHWWLAIFKLGFFCKPKHLKMALAITFPNKEMLNAFLKSFQNIGYTSKDYHINDTTFYFLYKKPKSKRVWTRNILIDTINNTLNKENVKRYNKYLKEYIETNYQNDVNNPNVININNLIYSTGEKNE